MPEQSSTESNGLAHQLNAQIQPIFEGLPVFVVPETESTNADLLRPDYQANSPLCVLLALKQSKGRGRQGRTWLSDEGSLTFSLRWQFNRSAAALNGLPLAVAVATVQGMESLGLFGISIKWPNDLLKGSAKLGGILLEIGKPVSEKMTHAIIGIGINIRQPNGSFKLDEPVSALFEDRHPELIQKEREEVMIAIIKKLIPTLIEFDEQGFSAFRTQWMQHAAWLGEKVELSSGTRGTLMGVDQDGALLLDTDLCIERFFSGDLSLRPAVV